MNKDNSVNNKLLPKTREKVQKNLVYVGIISSVMMFAGLSSAVLVRKMDKFWVNIHLPEAFVYSTMIIILSSCSLFLALQMAKKGNKKGVVYSLLFTIFLGFGFSYFQFKGWSSYYKSGNAVKSFITYVYGQYGQSYRIYKNSIPIFFNGEKYTWKGNDLSNVEQDSLKEFAYLP